MPLKVRWDAEQLGPVASPRHDLHVAPAVQRRRQQVLKGMRLRTDSFVKLGKTECCPRCEESDLRGWADTSRAHSNACRARLGGELKATPDGPRRMELHAKQEARWVLEEAVPAERGIELEVRDTPPFENLPEAQREGYVWPDEPAEGVPEGVPGAMPAQASQEHLRLPEAYDSDADDEAPPIEVAGLNGDVDMDQVEVGLADPLGA